MRARIYRPSRNAMQSGEARTHEWVLEFERESGPALDPLMGWAAGRDTRTQVRLRFPEQKAAEDYARDNGIAYVVLPPHPRRHVVRANGYADNYLPGRRFPWTH